MKFITACAIVMAAAYGAEAEDGWNTRGYGRVAYGAPRSYGLRAQAPPSGFRYSRRSTIRPRDVKAFNVGPVDNYYKALPKVDETIVASCEFDFLGYSHSSGRIELKQKVNDLTSMIGEFDGLSPGLHGIKIHEFGDLEYGCESTGDVFNPFGASQGNANEDIYDRRVGDIEQLSGRWDNKGEYKQRDLLVNLSGPNSVIGRSMVIYEREDDHDKVEHAPTKTKDARYRQGMGERIACCVIGLAKGEKKEIKNIPKAKTTLKDDAPEEIPVLKREAPRKERKFVAPRRQQVRYVAPVQAYAPRRGYGSGRLDVDLPAW